MPVKSWVWGMELYQQASFRMAEKYLLEGLNNNPYHPASNTIRYYLALTYSNLGEKREALQYLKKIVHNGAATREVYLFSSKLYAQLGKHILSAKILRKALNEFKSDQELILAYAYAVASNPTSERFYEEALRKLKAKQLVTSPESGSYFQLEAAMSALECAFGDRAVGEKLLVRSLAAGEAPAEAILLRAEILMNDGRVSQARDLAERVLKHDPFDPRPYAFLTRVYLREDEWSNPEFALQLSSTACSLTNWENPIYLSLLEISCEQAEEGDVAELVFRRNKHISQRRDFEEQIFTSPTLSLI